ncbi:cation transporter, partial [bacterium]
LEAIASIIAGKMANSIALIAFGLDSIVESLSAFVLIWRLKKHDTITEEEEEKIERHASRFVGITFFILGIYIAIESILTIVQHEESEASIPGIVIAMLSLLVMPLLARAKYKLGKSMDLESLVADSKETLVCAFLSVALLLGLLTNYLFGFWLADPIVGLVIVGFLFKEGVELVFEEEK